MSNPSLTELLRDYIMVQDVSSLESLRKYAENNGSNFVLLLVLKQIDRLEGKNHARKISELLLSLGYHDEYVFKSMKNIDSGDYGNIISFANHYCDSKSSDLYVSLINVAEKHGVYVNKTSTDTVIASKSIDTKKTSKQSKKSKGSGSINQSDYYPINYQQESTASNRESYYGEYKSYGEDWENSQAPYYNEDQHSNWDESQWD